MLQCYFFPRPKAAVLQCNLNTFLLSTSWEQIFFQLQLVEDVKEGISRRWQKSWGEIPVKWTMCMFTSATLLSWEGGGWYGTAYGRPPHSKLAGLGLIPANTRLKTFITLRAPPMLFPRHSTHSVAFLIMLQQKRFARTKVFLSFCHHVALQWPQRRNDKWTAAVLCIASHCFATDKKALGSGHGYKCGPVLS